VPILQRHLLAIAQLPWQPPCSFHHRQRDRRDRDCAKRRPVRERDRAVALSSRASPEGTELRNEPRKSAPCAPAGDGTGFTDRRPASGTWKSEALIGDVGLSCERFVGPHRAVAPPPRFAAERDASAAYLENARVTIAPMFNQIARGLATGP